MTSISEIANDHREKARTKKPRDDHNGHKIILKTMINKKQEVLLELLNGDIVRGYITQFDNYTITLSILTHLGTGERRVKTFFKHAVICFSPAE